MAKPINTGATISDVAVAAGVSRATVSRVMNGHATVAEEIAARVRAAARQLRYQPSNTARSLSLGRTNTVALIVPDLGNPMFQQVLRGAMAAAAAEGYHVLVAETAEDPTQEAEIALEARRRCDAVVLAAPRMPKEQLAELLPRLSPVVLLNRSAPGAPALSVDFAHGITLLVDHLVGHGHQELAYVAGPPTAVSHQVRADALADAVRRHRGLHLHTVDGGSTIEDGYRVADQVVDTRATGVIAFNDLVAFGLLARLNETGVAVPRDISVTGIDDIELARYATPSLTTAAVPQHDLGAQAWQLLTALIQGDDERIRAAEATGGLLAPRLVVRSSSGPVPPARRLALPASHGATAAVRRVDPDAPARWTIDGDVADLRWADVPLMRYQLGADMPRVHSPRPYLHPVHSLAGRAVTDVSPVDHRHHYGASVAVPEVDGTSYWGGRTFLRGRGPTLLTNHGRQVRTRLAVEGPEGRLVDTLVWADQNERQQLLEIRELTGLVIPEVDGWALDWRSELTAPTGATISSPAVNGRPRAGYGGIFWRLASADSTDVLTADATSESGAHGSRSRWLAFNRWHGGEWSAVIFAQQSADPLPWFVRVSDYVGAGPSVAWDEPAVVAPGESLVVELVTVVVDRRVTAQDAEDLAALAEARLGAARRAEA